MADFDTWKFSSLVDFARDSQARIKELEHERAELVEEIRKLLQEREDEQNRTP